MKSSEQEKQRRIRELNDQFRKSFVGGRIVVTPGIQGLARDQIATVVQKVQTFDTFTSDNDPHREHDFGAFEIEGQKFFWKIDYYNLGLDGGSEDPSDPSITTRVLTLMFAEEY